MFFMDSMASNFVPINGRQRNNYTVFFSRYYSSLWWQQLSFFSHKVHGILQNIYLDNGFSILQKRAAIRT